MSRWLVKACGVATLAAALVCAGLYARRARLPAAPPPEEPRPAQLAQGAATDEDEDTSPAGYSFHTPSGRPTRLGCAEARRIVAQVRGSLAAPPPSLDGRAFVGSAADWLDPHALWSVAKDAPRAALDGPLGRVARDVEAPRGACAGADASGAILSRWVDELRAVFDAARASARGPDLAGARERLPTDGEARAAARELGARVGGFDRALGDRAAPFAAAARERFFPPLDGRAWGEVVLAAAVRAYVPLVDPHGAWAPYDEEASVYDVDLASNAPQPLWAKGDPTALGVVVLDGPTAPLARGDVVLAIGGVHLAGLPLEQIEQIGLVASEAKAPLEATVLRGNELVTLAVGGPSSAPAARAEAALPTERITWGSSADVIVVAVRDVRDDLGDELARTIRAARAPGQRPLAGVVLDLRGNGGGSTDGALHAIGLFLPGARMFPMKRRDGTIDVERAAEPPEEDRYRGPVAALVDGATASAAEMLAGAFMAYGRGPSLGARTFGKGCAQEYFDDEPRTGVLRLTTLLYALPDGTAVQRRGLAPTLEVPFEALGGAKIADREAALAHAPPTWRGPDVRSPRPHAEPWGPLREATGACREADVCAALRVLAQGWPRRPAIAKRGR